MKGSEALLEAVKLEKSFVSGTETLTVLNGLDLKLFGGQSVAILGASGSGKSTLLYLLGGLDKPTSGSVFLRGKPISKLSDNDRALWRAKEIGFVFQFHHLLSEFDALENVSMPARIMGQTPKKALEKAEPLLERVGLGARKKHRPGALSGGEQQRVALARALMLEPSILLADEPTGNLDAKNAAMVNELICQLVAERGLSAVVATHNASLANMLGTSLELTGGKLKLVKRA
ncbi:MAG: ABC transporter ATP-binding protein [Deltaproteobacteria bacterium]|nr:ABC transporter ATP-binding protein [Deltaproteobacteria bacterium]